MGGVVLELANGYVFEKRIFRFLALALLIITVASLAVYGTGEHVYYRCPEDAVTYCTNPFIDPATGFCTVNEPGLCEQQAFPPGFTYGKPPAWIIANFSSLCFFLVVGAFLINHFKNNQRFAR